MHSNTLSIIASVLLAVVEADWVFTWPYGNDGSCRCEEKDVGSETYLTEEGCLEAFVESDYEYCSYKGRSVTDRQCDFAVSVTEGLHNSYCAGKCTEIVSGILSVEEFMKECDLEVVVDFDFAVATLPDRCFTTNIYGWGDYDPSSVQKPPLRQFEKVPTAARCQELCQDVSACAAFVWRAVPDHESTSSFQNEPLTCTLYDEEFMQHVVSDAVPNSMGIPTEYCNVPLVGECADISFPRSTFNLLEDQTCLICGCEPRCIYGSPSHVTGPVFCQRGSNDICEFVRPSWTTPPPECPTHEECPTAEEENTDVGTAGTDIVLTTVEGSTPTAYESSIGTSGTGDSITLTELGDPTTAEYGEGTTGFGGITEVTVSQVGSIEVSRTTGEKGTTTAIVLDTTEEKETTTGLLLETTEDPETTTTVEVETTRSSGSETNTLDPPYLPTEDPTTTSTIGPAISSHTDEQGSGTDPSTGGFETLPTDESTTTRLAPGISTTETMTDTESTRTGSGCVPDCPDCPCFIESECDDCYPISDCMDDEC